jgi:putative transposase
LAIEVDTSLPAERVLRVLDQVTAWRGQPQAIRLDNGPEFLAATYRAQITARSSPLEVSP